MKVELYVNLEPGTTFREIEDAFKKAIHMISLDPTHTKVIDKPEPTFWRDIAFDRAGFAVGQVRVAA
jgi:hypothetical protein